MDNRDALVNIIINEILFCSEDDAAKRLPILEAQHYKQENDDKITG